MTQPEPVPAPPQPPTPPLPPPAIPGQGVRVVVPGVPTPIALQDVGALRARVAELSRQIQSATSRRTGLARELRRSEPGTADRAGIEARIQLLDQRILQLENDITQTGQLLAMAPALGLTGAEGRRGRDGIPRDRADRAPFAFVLALVLLVPIALAASRRIWRGTSFTAAPVDMESRERLARLETAVDAIAIEVERVAEGQRFVTKLLADTVSARPLAAVDATRRDAVRVAAEQDEA